LFNRSGVIYAAIFGSRVKGTAKENSDYDILIEYDKTEKYSLTDLVSLKRELEKNISGEVDLVTTRGLNPKIAQEVQNAAKVIYDRK